MSTCQGSCCHNYNAYSRGCRCPVCRDAKAAYMRERRREATSRARPGVAVEGVLHGTRAAYEEGGCRCDSCMRAEQSSTRWSRKARVLVSAGGAA